MAVRVRASPRPTVSASYGSDFKGRYAIDGVEATEWLLPDGATGWLELDFSGGKQLREVRLLNARNRHYLDRGTKRAKLVTSRAGEAVETLEVELPGPTEKSRERRVKLRGMQVDKLRIEVLSHHGLGAGLAEVSYD